MQRLVASLIFLSLLCGPFAFALDNTGAAKPDYPPSGYRPLPPHFQPRRLIAADMDKVSVAPPPLPSYEQPTIPAQGYLWVPGFWAWRKSVPDYFWVPGTWVQPPQPGLLWTPPYWSRVDDGYAFHTGYWAAEVGFYGGINYGYGYAGDGYQGGRWENDTFSYNRAVNNLGSLGIRNVYDQSVTADDNAVRVSFNGGRGGTAARATSHQEALASVIGATAEQQKHFELAAMDRALYSKLNNGEPGVAATPHAGVLDGAGITRSRGETPDHSAQSVDDVAIGVSTKRQP
jgi:WXXGXW repeat (2 copies)